VIFRSFGEACRYPIVFRNDGPPGLVRCCFHRQVQDLRASQIRDPLTWVDKLRADDESRRGRSSTRSATLNDYANSGATERSRSGPLRRSRSQSDRRQTSKPPRDAFDVRPFSLSRTSPAAHTPSRIDGQSDRLHTPEAHPFMPGFIHDFKHGISAISNHSVPLLSTKEHISRPRSGKERWVLVALIVERFVSSAK
jgi:hypothetical protein